MEQPEFDTVTEGYLDYMKGVRKLRHRTLTDIRCSYRKVVEYTQERHPDKEIWQLDLEEYIRWIGAERNKGKKAGSINKQLSHLRGLLEYAWRIGRLDRNVLEGFILKDAQTKKLPYILSHQDAEILIQAADGSTAGERKSRLLVLLLYGCGLRTSELANVNVQDINCDRQELAIKQGKGGIDRVLPVPDGVWTELLAYVAERGGKRGPLFKTAVKRKRISTREISDTVRELGKRAGIREKITPMTLRHTFASHLYHAGARLEAITTLMGHTSADATDRYLHALGLRLTETGGAGEHEDELYNEQEEEK